MVENLYEDGIREQVLLDNTAQGILNSLKEIENKREIYEKRWIWELLQNALDAAPPDGRIEVDIVYNADKLVFRHTGRPFKKEEVAHLIFHGSTKTKKDEHEFTIGKFGTGFITTHLLSKKIKVRGIREDNKSFEFELNREGNTPDEIKDNSEKSWDQYKNSLTELFDKADFSTEFEYLLDHSSSNTVKVGIDELTKIAPFVLAFNEKLRSLKIVMEEYSIKFELGDVINETTWICKKIIKEIGDAHKLHELLIAKGDDIEIALSIKTQDKVYQIENLQDIPKIFFAFPLFGTQDLPLPVVVNSIKFEPTEKRDGIFLGRENTPEIERNKNLLKNAVDLFVRLIMEHRYKFHDIHNILLNLKPPASKDWLDQNWYVNSLLRPLIEKIKDVPIVKTEDGDFKPYSEVFYPFVGAMEKDKTELLWELSYSFLDYRGKIPSREIAFNWAEIIRNWEEIELDLTNKITVEKIAEKIAESRNLQNFKAKLSEDINGIEFINKFCKLLLGLEKRELLSENILPDQNGNFKKERDLYKDEGIDEALKDVSCKLGEDVRDILLNKEIINNIQELRPPKNQDDVLSAVLQKIRQKCSNDDNYLQANLELFKWLLENNKFNYLDGYRLLTADDGGGRKFIQLNKEVKFLAPKDIWDEKAQDYADLFPQDIIISSIYFEKIPLKDKWEKLKDSGFIFTNPLYKKTVEKLKGDDLELLAAEQLSEDEKHELKENVELSYIFFLDEKDKGIIDTMRKSKGKAQRFLMFLFDYVIERDTGWENLQTVECECGSKHKIYTSEWLGKLKERSWVPISKNKSDKPTANSLALLLRDNNELLKKCKQNKPLRLLNRLNVGFGELMMNVVVTKDDEIKFKINNAFGSLVSVFGENPDNLIKVVELLESTPDLLIQEIEELKYKREQVRRNQHIGAQVEKILKDMLEKEGFRIEVTGIGSDFIIEHDFVRNDKENVLEIKKEEKLHSYIEIKATSQNFVRMTLKQAKEARDKSDKYILCVVPIGVQEVNIEEVRNQARFIIDIGQKIRDKVEKAEHFKLEQEEISEEGDIEIEVSEVQIRFKINETVWGKGKTFDEFLEFLRGMQK